MDNQFDSFSTDELERELSRRELVQQEIQRRIYAGELEVTDGDDIHDQPGSWRNS